MKIALASVQFINNDINHNKNQILKYMNLAKENNSDLVCFGESFLQGFDGLNWNYNNDINIAIEIFDNIINEILNYSKEINIDVIFGYFEKDKNNIYSSCLFIENGSIKYNYRRISKGWKVVSKTNEYYKEGDEIKVINYKSKNIVIALCGDLWDCPDKFKLNQDITIWPVYVNFTKEEWNEELEDYTKQANKVSNKTLLINSISNNPKSLGGSFYFKNGLVEDKLEFAKEDILIITL